MIATIFSSRAEQLPQPKQKRNLFGMVKKRKKEGRIIPFRAATAAACCAQDECICIILKKYLLCTTTGKCFEHSFQYPIPYQLPRDDPRLPGEQSVARPHCTCPSDSGVLILNSMPSQGVPLTLFRFAQKLV